MLRTILFFSWFWLTVILTTPLIPPVILMHLVGLGRPARRFTGALGHLWAGSILKFAGIRATVRGLDKVPKEGPICFVANHQGDFDIILMVAKMPVTVGFLAKRFAGFVPVFGWWAALLGSVFINRKSIKDGKSAIDKGVKSLKKGKALCIFPEGTRSRSPKMNIFRNGSFKMATRAEAWLIPVSIDGTWQSWEHRMRIVPAEVTLTVHDPIDTRGMDTEARKALPDRVRQIIASGLGEP